jgi:hypothetical protein
MRPKLMREKWTKRKISTATPARFTQLDGASVDRVASSASWRKCTFTHYARVRERLSKASETSPFGTENFQT